MNAWNSVLSEVFTLIKQLREANCPDPFFRGHGDSKWPLLPGIARKNYNPFIEGRLYYRFVSLGGHLIPDGVSSWDNLFLMQHHGLPTRLLDWTENFAVALYFAVQECESEASIWILDPYELNRLSIGKNEIPYITSAFPEGYENYFLDDESKVFGKFPADVISVEGSGLNTGTLSSLV